MDWTSDPQSVLIRVQLAGRGAGRRGAAQAALHRARSICSCSGWSARRCCCSASPRCSCATRCARSAAWPRRPRRSAWGATSGRSGRRARPRCARRPPRSTGCRSAIRRFLAQRTEMLAGVSHDLRTPLTRLRLALAMLPPHDELRQDVAEMTADVEEMERMIGGYLAFARGEGTEQAEPVDLSRGAGGGRRGGAPGRRRGGAGRAAGADAAAARRCGAAGDHQPGRQCAPARAPRRAGGDAAGPRSVQVTVDDDGPGIPPDRRESVFRPFESGCGRRHRARADHRARHRPRAWRGDRAGGQPAGRPARADQAAGMSPIAAAGAASRTTSSATRIPRHPRRGDGPGSSGGPRIRDADEGPTSPSPPAPSFRPSLRRIACSTGPTLRHWIAGSGH